MVEVERASTPESLEHFQERLDCHFRRLHERRQGLDPQAPVFALEHGLDADDLKLLQGAVVAAHREHCLAQASRRWWLPLAVHAAEVGYIYDGVEYWPMYTQATPGWEDNEYERDRVRGWFEKFVEDYGGATPRGAWAETFRKIAWPITHAVLPRYLQLQLVRMLADYRTGWPSLIHDPGALGLHLHSWSRHYSDRLEKFCQNTALVGHVAVALLLSDEDEESPYIESATLARLVESLNSERESRRWLQEARRSANTVRMRSFRRPAGTGRQRSQQKRLPTATDPTLLLKRERGTWKAYAVLPDVKPLQHALPIAYEEMRKSRAIVAGAQQMIPTGGLLFATSPVEFDSWPSPAQAFLQLQRASREVNLLLADQCRITNGPWWVFRRKPGAPAIEVKGKFVRPGARYCIVGSPELVPPAVPWCTEVEIAVEGACAYDLRMPTALSDTDLRALVSAGIAVISDISIQPVGVVASSWDGEGSAEWLAGEPALIAIHAQHSPPKARLTIDGEPYYVEWPEGEAKMFLSLDGLSTGTHEIVVSLSGRDGGKADGTLIVTIRDPKIRPQGASLGEGIRLRTMPAQPSLPDLWDGRAVVAIDGPEDAAADLKITLRGDDGVELGSCRRNIRLPVKADEWTRIFSRMRESRELAKNYDKADIADLAISRAGIGFATLSCERGFRGLRWVVSARHRDGRYAARLIDRTDSNPVSVKFFSVEHPLIGEAQPANKEFVGPWRGGLLWATNGEQVAGQIIPPDPNQLLRLGAVEPSVPTAQKSLAEVLKLMRSHQQWKDAELPGNPFGMRERQRVLNALTRAMAITLSPGQWEFFERKNVGAPASDIDLNRARALLGGSPAQRATAQTIASNLWRWNSPETLIQGFGNAISDLSRSAGMPNAITGARFLLQLASSPSHLLDWDEPERNQYLRCVLTEPALMRAARFTVLGAVEEAVGGVLGERPTDRPA